MPYILYPLTNIIKSDNMVRLTYLARQALVSGVFPIVVIPDLSVIRRVTTCISHCHTSLYHLIDSEQEVVFSCCHLPAMSQKNQIRRSGDLLT